MGKSKRQLKPNTPPADEATNERGLTDRQQAFINEYFLCGFNATEAAKRAGYSIDSARQMGSENLSKPSIRAEIERRMAEYAMTANEALARLANQARGDLADVFTEDGEFDFKEARQRGQTALIKKLKRKRTIRHVKDDDGHYTDEVEDEQFEIELYDAQAANLAIMKQWKLDNGEPTERTEVTDGLTDEQRATRIAALLESARTRRAGQASGND